MMQQQRQARRRRSDGNVAIAAAVGIAMLAIILFMFASCGGFGGCSSEKPAETTVETPEQEKSVEYPEADRLRISGAIAEAASQASSKNYSGALNTISKMLKEYPDSTELKDKYDEYAKLLTAQKAAEAESDSSDGKKADAGESSKTVTMASTDGAVNVRNEPSYKGSVVTVIEQGQKVSYNGKTEQGPDSDGSTYDWLYVEVSEGVAGWVRSGLISEVTADTKTEKPAEEAKPAEETKPAEEEKPAESEPEKPAEQTATGDLTADELRTSSMLVLVPRGDTVLRAEATDASASVSSVSSGGELYYYGISTSGPGDDGATHTWCYVQLGADTFGWVRADQVNVG